MSYTHPNRRPDSERISIEELRARFDYDPINGGMMRKPKTDKSRGGGKNKKIGRIKSNGYVSVKITHDGRHVDYMMHHLVFAWHHGRWPVEIGHDPDPNKQNNRIENLKEQTRKENMAYRKRGVYRIDGKGQEKFYPSVLEAARGNFVSDTSVCAAASGRQETAGGYRWRYA